MKFIIFLIILFNGIFVFGQEKYVLPCSEDLLEQSYIIALLEIGTQERTNNNDGIVYKYQRALGLKEGSPYCAAGVYWCFLSAIKLLGIDESDIPILKSAVANSVFNDARKRGNNVSYIPQKHCLIVWRRINSWSGHIERIIEIQNAGWVITVGFNTRNKTGQQGVFVRRRHIFHPLGRLAIRGMVGFSDNGGNCK